MHSCVYTLSLCVHSYRGAHHKQTFASMSLQKNKGIFPSLYRKAPHSKGRRATASTLSSIPLVPAALWDPSSPVLHFQRDLAPHNPASRLSPGADGGAKRESCPAKSLCLQCNSLATQHFPTEGPPNAPLLACL